MDKTYDPGAVEPRIYGWWEEHGYFKPRPDGDRPPFEISMPPPNVTGELHLGHALTATLEDIMIRYHRMRGDTTLWVPGSDHAGIGRKAHRLYRGGATNHGRPRRAATCRDDQQSRNAGLRRHWRDSDRPRRAAADRDGSRRGVALCRASGRRE